jgi:hypothetical protein
MLLSSFHRTTLQSYLPFRPEMNFLIDIADAMLEKD